MSMRTITLSDRPPVRINEDNWPAIANSADSWHDNQYEFQANRKANLSLRVRRHKDGRAIVYAAYDYDTRYQGEPNRQVRHGVLLAAGATDADICAAIKDVAARMESSADCGDDAQRWPQLADDCIADMPAQDVDAPSLADALTAPLDAETAQARLIVDEGAPQFFLTLREAFAAIKPYRVGTPGRAKVDVMDADGEWITVETT